MVLQRLSHLMQKAGGTVRIEPNWFDGKRPDAQVHLAYENVMIDVAIIHPAAPTYCRSAAASALAASKRREKDKIAKYRDLAREEECRFIPVILETFGSFGPQATNFLKELGNAPLEQTQSMGFKIYITSPFSDSAVRQRLRYAEWLPAGSRVD